MHAFRRIGIIVFVLCVAITSLVFVLENQQPSTLLFFGWSTPSLPISLYVAVSLLLGMVVGPLTLFVVRCVSGQNKRPS
ncbi:DUF1049 domain-containing protein [Pseudomonas sp. F01002]|nr:DUF1049 domain-containing protein [Pseudomonas sp. ANT_J28]TFB35685.1 DUF1049 domain-containing protein [Pseudomonas sp. F01002]